MDANRVVITGMGIYSTIGKNINEVKDSLYKGKSGIGLDTLRKEKYGFRSGLTGVLEDPNLKGRLSRRFGARRRNRGARPEDRHRPHPRRNEEAADRAALR